MFALYATRGGLKSYAGSYNFMSFMIFMVDFFSLFKQSVSFMVQSFLSFQMEVQ
jgi:hypothetical protein